MYPKYASPSCLLFHDFSLLITATPHVQTKTVLAGDGSQLDSPAYYAVAIGGLLQSDLSPGPTYPGSFACTSKVSRIVAHPQYFGNSDKAGDAALLYLTTPCNVATPMALYTGSDEMLFSTRSTGKPDGTVPTLTMGWGVTSYPVPGKLPNNLMQVGLPLMPQSNCSYHLSILRNDGYHTESMYCAGRATGGVDSCAGDSGKHTFAFLPCVVTTDVRSKPDHTFNDDMSRAGTANQSLSEFIHKYSSLTHHCSYTRQKGGPLFYQDPPTGNCYMLGIVSRGRGCGVPGFYGIYARVPYVASWITGQGVQFCGDGSCSGSWENSNTCPLDCGGVTPWVCLSRVCASE